MRELAKALYSFLSSFNIPAYVEDNLPEDASLPYITYTLSKPDWKDPTSIQVRVWYKSNSYLTLMQKVDEIAEAIEEGYSVKTETGNVVIYKDMNFVQIQPFIEESKLRVAYLNLIVYAHMK